MKDIDSATQQFGILDYVPVGVFILRNDFVVIFWNSCLEDWTGIPRGKIVGSPIQEFFPHFETPRYASRLKDIFSGGPPTIFSSQLHNHIIPSFLSHNLMRIQHTVITSIQAPQGNGYYALFAIQDVTDLTIRSRDYKAMRDQALEEVRERKRVEEELIKTQEGLEVRVKERTADLVLLNKRMRIEIHERRKAEDELKKLVTTLNTLIDHIPEGALLLDPAFGIILANSIGTKYLDILSPEGDGIVLEEIAGLPVRDLFLKAHDKVYSTIELEGPPRIIFEVSGSSIGGHENPRGMVLIIKDVTEERHQEERIHSQERLAAVGQLAAGIAHDFNNILTGIIGLSEMMLSENTLCTEDRYMTEAVLSNGLKAAHLIRQILDFSRKSISEKKPLELMTFLRDFIKFISRTIPETISISAASEPGEYIVSADPTKIEQVLANLALNARDAMTEGGRLSFNLSRFTLRHYEKPPVPDMPDGDWVRLTISDTGAGMTPVVFARIFEPFFTTKEPGKGTGLGLSQVYGIIKQHDGFLDVMTEVGKGSSFHIYLPSAGSAPELPETGPETVLLQGNSETILVVEDDDTVRNLVMRSLSRLNFRVVSEPNGREALARFEVLRSSVKLVITDMVMPEMGGIELSRTINRMDPEVKIIALTGYPLGSEREDLHKAGIIECIQKPFQVQTLVRAVVTALEKRDEACG